MRCAGALERAGTPLASLSTSGSVAALRPSRAGAGGRKRSVAAELFPGAGSAPGGGGCVRFGAGEGKSEPPPRGRGPGAALLRRLVLRCSPGPRARPPRLRAPLSRAPAPPALGALTPAHRPPESRREPAGERRSRARPSPREGRTRPGKTTRCLAQPWCPGPPSLRNSEVGRDGGGGQWRGVLASRWGKSGCRDSQT